MADSRVAKRAMSGNASSMSLSPNDNKNEEKKETDRSTTNIGNDRTLCCVVDPIV